MSTYCWAETKHPTKGTTLTCTDHDHPEGMHRAFGFAGPRGDTVEVHRWPLVDGFTASPVCLDELVTVWGEYDPRARWNGWLMPRIDAWAAERVLTVIAAEHTATGEPDRITWDWADDGTLTVVETYEPGADATDVYEPDADGLVALGAGGWVWAEDTDDDATDRATRGVGSQLDTAHPHRQDDRHPRS